MLLDRAVFVPSPDHNSRRRRNDEDQAPSWVAFGSERASVNDSATSTTHNACRARSSAAAGPAHRSSKLAFASALAIAANDSIHVAIVLAIFAAFTTSF